VVPSLAGAATNNSRNGKRIRQKKGPALSLRRALSLTSLSVAASVPKQAMRYELLSSWSHLVNLRGIIGV
jgi:hypothetical protein